MSHSGKPRTGSKGHLCQLSVFRVTWKILQGTWCGHRTTPNPFEKIGIALGNARLLVQAFSNEERRRQLAGIVSAVKASLTSAAGKFKKGKSIVVVDESWHNWCSSRKPCLIIQRCHSGCTRTHKFTKCYTLDNVFCYLTNVYFPNGKRLEKKIVISVTLKVCFYQLPKKQ